MNFMFFEVGRTLHRDFQENYGQQELLNTGLVKNHRGHFRSDDSRIQRVRELVSKLKQKPAAGSETTEVDDKLD